MRFKTIDCGKGGDPILLVEIATTWRALTGCPDEEGLLQEGLLSVLEWGRKHGWQELEERIEQTISEGTGQRAARETGAAALPFQPCSFRDFMLYEEHAIAAARGFVREFLPAFLPLVRAYETVFRRPFPPLRPKRCWYEMPIYYMGNHLSFVPSGAPVAIPSSTRELDYELELGAVLVRPIRDATAEDALAAVGGFFVLNDFSARDVQLSEMRSGFGPVKSKHFATAMSDVVVTPDELDSGWEDLRAEVRINGSRVATSSSGGMQFTIGEALAYASRDEELHAGEMFGFGTLPGCSGIENGRFLRPGDRVKLSIEGIGSVENSVRESGEAPATVP